MTRIKKTRKQEVEISIDLSKDFKKMLRRNGSFLKELSD